jgi:hypothetical protein
MNIKNSTNYFWFSIISLFYERPIKSVFQTEIGLKKQNERNFYGEQPIEVATTIITLDLFNEVTRKEKYIS